MTLSESFSVAELNELVELALCRGLLDPREVLTVLEAELCRRSNPIAGPEHERLELMRLALRLRPRAGAAEQRCAEEL